MGIREKIWDSLKYQVGLAPINLPRHLGKSEVLFLVPEKLSSTEADLLEKIKAAIRPFLDLEIRFPPQPIGEKGLQSIAEEIQNGDPVAVISFAFDWKVFSEKAMKTEKIASGSFEIFEAPSLSLLQDSPLEKKKLWGFLKKLLESDAIQIVNQKT